MIADELARVNLPLLLLSTTLLIMAPLAWRFGRGPELLLAGVLLVKAALDLLLAFSGAQAGTFRAELVLLDIAVLISVGAIALRANRSYPLIMAGAALIAPLSHVMHTFGLLQGRFSYQVLTAAPTYLMAAIFAAGLACNIRRERRSGPQSGWALKSSRQTIAANHKIG